MRSPGFRCAEARFADSHSRFTGETFVGHVGFLDMHNLVHWFSSNGSVIAVLVTVCVAVLLVCCLGCSNCPSRDKDDLFRRHEL